ncbi:isocitrate lyase/phosphoenolpyruvate mutase family protein [Flavobacterium sp. Fl-77]|uniref:Isocitrate lyase/phosphoenolpyruvate mutase family protein n=1 Tax=Flavobacterium flavipigmentatum TaxID=2893884 RepID=A0AAJ2SC53_9FLAO|nr:MULTISPECIES: isocitrate lyase/phosphoenolpyruvate mutase family protein [unclassified Flavobacterium]MDX6182421.1 isocitrate lyase/phosphoenolpyruvate mutase family protein [Flavobacterium sp. Fl-33]MDX6185666.1 isocitrate lyase/phosphoenolpyruvate mutase family protein [Flavobacterium sp. Fl-77]UFH38851.1 isocitrate lyase/phosphoenolpyruvate mutase family protein [Flavobacterium sp. F-70]
MIYTQKEKAQQFHKLHNTGELFVLPNIWDPLGAALLENLEYPAIATASASVAYSNGLSDGEKITFDEVLNNLGKITNSVNIPVTADIESGYATNNKELENNIKRLIEKGIVGINIEDTNRSTNNLYTIKAQCDRIKLIKKVSIEMDIPLFINARTDVFLHEDSYTTEESKFEEILNRGLAYKDAGANCFFPIAITSQENIQQLFAQLKMPINILTIPGIPDLITLHNLGVVRVSLGPSLLKIAIKAMKHIALQFKENQGLSTIIENEITSDYLKMLIKKK